MDSRHTIDLVRQARIPRPTQIMNGYPKELEAVVLKALQRDLALRFQSAEEFRNALEQYLRNERIVVPPAGVGGLVKRVLGGRIEHHRGLIREAVAALDAGPEARARWLAEPQAPPPKDAGTTTTTTTSTTSASPMPRPTLPPPPPPPKRPFMSRSQLNWTIWLMFMAAGTVFAWWLH